MSATTLNHVQVLPRPLMSLWNLDTTGPDNIKASAVPLVPVRSFLFPNFWQLGDNGQADQVRITRQAPEAKKSLLGPQVDFYSDPTGQFYFHLLYAQDPTFVIICDFAVDFFDADGTKLFPIVFSFQTPVNCQYQGFLDQGPLPTYGQVTLPLLDRVAKFSPYVTLTFHESDCGE